MNARRRLNIACMNGCFLIAGVIGLGTQSWIAFLVAMAVMIAYGLYLGEIRPKPNR